MEELRESGRIPGEMGQEMIDTVPAYPSQFYATITQMSLFVPQSSDLKNGPAPYSSS